MCFIWALDRIKTTTTVFAGKMNRHFTGWKIDRLEDSSQGCFNKDRDSGKFCFNLNMIKLLEFEGYYENLMWLNLMSLWWGLAAIGLGE